MAAKAPSDQLLGSSGISVKIHPLVLFAITDHYMRRPKDQPRVLGTLLGQPGDNVSTVSNTIPVMHSEKEAGNVRMDKEKHQQMKSMCRKVNSREEVLGWYSTAVGDADGNPVDVDFNSCVMQRYYDAQVRGNRTIHLVLDPTLATGKVSVRAYVGKEIALGDSFQFREVPVEIVASNAERIGINAIIRSTIDADTGKAIADPPVLGDIKPLDDSVQQLLKIVSTLSDYVDGVVEGKIEKNAEVGLKIANTVAAIPHVDPESFDAMFNSSVQDLLMVSSLSKLTQLQMAIAEQVGQLPFLTPPKD